MTTRDRRDRGVANQVVGLSEKVVDIKRVAKVVKGGRRFSFNAMVVVGDGAGHVGVGLGKAGVVPEAVRKGGVVARRSLISVRLKGSTIPHEIIQKYGASKVLLKPAAPGTGIIAGASTRAVVTAVGIRDILTKSLASPNPINLVKATYMALQELREPEQAVRERKELAAALAASPPPEPRSPRPPRPRRQPESPEPVPAASIEPPAALPVEERPPQEQPESPEPEPRTPRPRTRRPSAPAEDTASAAPREEGKPPSGEPPAEAPGPKSPRARRARAAPTKGETPTDEANGGAAEEGHA